MSNELKHQQERAIEFHRLHSGEKPLILVNDGTYAAMTAEMLSAADVNKLFLRE